jgi:hypothetical protein
MEGIIKLSTKTVKPRSRTLSFIETEDDSQYGGSDNDKWKQPSMIWVFFLFQVFCLCLCVYLEVPYVIGYLTKT